MPDVWPVTLPQSLLLTGYAEALPDGRLRSQTDTGPGKVRRKTSAMPSKLRGSMLMSAAQIGFLRTFVDTTTLGGSLPFTLPDPLGGAALLVRFGEELPTWEGVTGDLFQVKLDLEVLP